MENLSACEAFDDFMANVWASAFPPGKRKGKEYNRVQQAIYARNGRGKRTLTKEWVASIIQDYAYLVPGRYKIVKSETEIYAQQKSPAR